MPNISFDIFFDKDVVNITASRGQHAPKVKPQWKTRTAPKLPPKEPPAPVTAVFAKPTREEKASEKEVQPRKPAPKLEKRYIGSYVDQVVGGAMKAGGGFAGDAVGSVGDGINSFGSGIEKSIRRYGDATKNYGNAIKDWTDADGPRNPTASNPLGLSGSTVGGRRALGWSKPASSPSSSPAYRTPSALGTKAAIRPSSSAKSLQSKNSNNTGISIRKTSYPSKSSGLGIAAKNQGLTRGKPSTNAVRKVPMAGPTVNRNQVSIKK